METDRPSRLKEAMVVYKPNQKNPGGPPIGKTTDQFTVIACQGGNRCQFGCGTYIPNINGNAEPVLLEKKVNQKRQIRRNDGSVVHPAYYIGHKNRPNTEEENLAQQLKLDRRAAIVPPPSFEVVVIPLTTDGEMGGAHLVGYRGHWLMFDCGGFTDSQDWHEGMKQIHTATRGLKKLEKMWGTAPKIDAVFITHGHFDHFASLKKMRLEKDNGEIIPVLRTPVANAFITKSFAYDGHPPLDRGPNDEWIFTPGDSFQVGEFKITSFGVPHSIPEACGFLIEVGNRRIVLMGDFKFESPIEDESAIFRQNLSLISQQPVDLLITEALGVSEEGRTDNESIAIANIERLIAEEVRRAQTENRKAIIRFACFSSHLWLIREVMIICSKLGLKAFFEGQAMKNALFIGRHFYDFKSVEEVIWQKTEENGQKGTLYFHTGCQGEQGSSLWKMTQGYETELARKLEESGLASTADRIEPNDLIFISSRIIPGNENRVREIISGIKKRGGRVVVDHRAQDVLQDKDIFAETISVSGHGKRDDFLELVSRLKPRKIIPYHGTENTAELVKACLPDEARDTVVTPQRLIWTTV